MYVINTEDRCYGPFESHHLAYLWAERWIARHIVFSIDKMLPPTIESIQKIRNMTASEVGSIPNIQDAPH